MKQAIVIVSLLLLVACGGKDVDKDENFNPTGEESSESPPRLSYIVRTSLKTGRAMYAIASFDAKTSHEALAQLAEAITDWKEIPKKAVLDSKRTLPQSSAKETFFVRSPKSFNAYGYNPPGPAGGPGYGYGNPPGPAGGPGMGYGGAYPYCGYGGYANCYGYAPMSYYNAWYYWNPCYYYPTANYGFSFYAYGW